MDADFRRPRQHEIFGLDNLEGLSTMMAVRDSEPYLKGSGYPNLWVLTSGPMPPEPTEMLAVRAAALAEQLRSLNALVLIDSPPILPVNDARLIAPHTDGVLMVLAAARAEAVRRRGRAAAARAGRRARSSAWCSTSPATTWTPRAATTTSASRSRAHCLGDGLMSHRLGGAWLAIPAAVLAAAVAVGVGLRAAAWRWPGWARRSCSAWCSRTRPRCCWC